MKPEQETGANQYMLLLENTYPFNIFEPRCDGLTLFTPHWHEQCLEIIVMLEGEVELHIGGQSFTGRSGDIFLIKEGVIHSGYVVDQPPKYYTILIDRYRLADSDYMNIGSRSLLTRELHLPTILNRDDEHYLNCSGIIHAIIQEYLRKSEGFELAFKSYLHILLLELSRGFGESGRVDRRNETAKRNMEGLKEVISYIEGHYAKKLTVSETSRIAGMSPYHFCRVFKHAVGRTLIEYIHLYRIGKAESLLQNTNLSVTVIAEKIGFGSIQYMDELFKRYRGCTPNQFRKQT